MTNFIPILLVLVAILHLYFIARFFKDPVFLFVNFWWYLWIIISSLIHSENYLPVISYVLVLIFLGALSVGGGIATMVLPQSLCVRPENARLKKSFRIFFYITTTLLILFYGRIASNYIGLSESELAGLRTTVYNEGGAVYQNKILLYATKLLLDPLVLALFALGISLLIRSGDYIVFFISSLLLAIQSTAFLGRFSFYYILAAIIFIFIASRNKLFIKLKATRKTLLTIAISLVLSLTGIALVTILRSQTTLDDLSDLFINNYLLTYHTIGFDILADDITNNNSIIHDKTYGFSSILTFLDPFVLLLRLAGFDVVPEYGNMVYELNFARSVYSDIYGGFISVNAFGTILYGPYRDGGILGVAFFSLIFGFFMQAFSRLQYKSFFATMVLYLLYHVAFFGIFQPMLNVNIYFAILGSYLIYKNALVVTPWQPRKSSFFSDSR